jgi:hypothetical protein
MQSGKLIHGWIELYERGRKPLSALKKDQGSLQGNGWKLAFLEKKFRLFRRWPTSGEKLPSMPKASEHTMRYVLMCILHVSK